MSEKGELEKRIKAIELGQIRTFGTSQISPSVVIQLLDEACTDFGGIVLVQSLGKRTDPDETHYEVDKKYWTEVLEQKKDGKHGEAWFEFKDSDRAVKAFLKWFGGEQ